MSDFFQNGTISTLHNLADRSVEELEKDLMQFRSQGSPMSLILPALYSELEGPALGHIVNELTKVPYLDEIIIGLDRADERQFLHAKEYFSRLPQHFRIIWNDGPRMGQIQSALADQDLAPQQAGKGRNVWYCLGYFLASGRAQTVALHDCDILTYSRDLPAKLFYPVANPTFGYKFCKGYYYRASKEKLNGRVSRLLVTPLIRTLGGIMDHDFLDYL